MDMLVLLVAVITFRRLLHAMGRVVLQVGSVSAELLLCGLGCFGNFVLIIISVKGELIKGSKSPPRAPFFYRTIISFINFILLSTFSYQYQGERKRELYRLTLCRLSLSDHRGHLSLPGVAP